ncbi:hypothetical protein BC941DRAFT_512951 [Chlamydoabsidia padenii]|nr:hypothetical protein BC941DRAFT_512951 [Chlamydoabsidia padenii]
MAISREQVMEDILDTTHQLTQYRFGIRNQDVTNHLSHLPTQQVLHREATPQEAKLFATCWTQEEIQQYSDIFQELEETSHIPRSFDRVIALAEGINSISPTPKVEKKIAELKKQYEECQVILEYMNSTVKDNERALKIHEQQQQDAAESAKKTWAASERELHLENEKVAAMEERLYKKQQEIQEARLLIQEKQQRLAQLKRQQHLDNAMKKQDQVDQQDTKQEQLERIEQLKLAIQAKKAQLNASPPPPQSSDNTTLSDQLQLKVIRTTPSEHQKNANKQVIPIVESIIQTLKDIIQQFSLGKDDKTVLNQQHDKAEVLKDELDKLKQVISPPPHETMTLLTLSISLFLARILTRLNKDIQQARTISIPNEQDRKLLLMSLALVLIHQQPNGRIPLEELKHRLTTYAVGLGIDPGLGYEAIYNWVGKSVVTIDRSSSQSIVQSNWDE